MCIITLFLCVSAQNTPNYGALWLQHEPIGTIVIFCNNVSQWLHKHKASALALLNE